MTADERIEKLLNRFGQTISDLPTVKDFKNYEKRDKLLNSMTKAEDYVEEWFDPDDPQDFYGEALPAYICHLADVIDRMETALETALRPVSCQYCRHYRDPDYELCPDCLEESAFELDDAYLHDIIEEHETILSEYALQALADMKSTIPCDNMTPCEWCEENCKPEFKHATAECWKHFLMKKEDGE